MQSNECTRWPTFGLAHDAGLTLCAGVGGYHAPLVTTGSKASAGNPARVYVYNGAEDPGITDDSITAFQVTLIFTLSWYLV